MSIEPMYTPENIKPAYRLYYNWVGWPSKDYGLPKPDASFFAKVAHAWEADGIRLLERSWSCREGRLLTSVKPHVAPVFFTARMKGRLQHELRNHQMPVKFSRKIAMLTVGENRNATVERYVESQARKERLADPKTNDFLAQFTVHDSAVDLAAPTPTNAGRYWYNLHLVLVTRNRFRITNKSRLATLRDGCLQIARMHGHKISRLAVLFDHLHIALRGSLEQSPETIALCYMNNLAYLLRHDALWQQSYYVGAFGQYDMGAIRLAFR